MLSSKKAVLNFKKPVYYSVFGSTKFSVKLFGLILLLSSLLIYSKILKAGPSDKAKAFAQFPPEPIKFVRAKKPLKLLLSASPAANELPFWRSKKDIQRKMHDERLIPVSVLKSNLADDQIGFDVKGAGIVHATANSAYKASLEFNKLTQVSSHFKSAFYDEKNSQLFLVIEALGYETRMILAIDQLIEKKRSEIQFEVVWGELKGMTGAIGFENVDDESCEVSIISHYQAAHFPLPKIFMGVAFEVITQKVAEKMRSFLESQK